MTRLIDADALTDELIKGMEADTDKSIQATFAKSVCMILCKAIERQPTVDAVPVKHGKWELIRMEDNGDGFYTCSNCDRGDIHSPLVSVPYCWYCGARMDADAE